jgi:Uma2 family endonuclease
MNDVAEKLTMSAAEYLAWEREQLGKHEYHLGEIFAMAGGKPRHNYLALAIGAELRHALRRMPCQAFQSDQKVSVERDKRYVYPDVVAAGGGARFESGTTDVLENPMIIVEVLSASTEKFDRGDKWGAYQKIESLKDYLLVSQSAARIEHYQRQADGSWRYIVAESGGSITLSNDARMSVDDIYAGAFEVPSDE